MSVITTHQGGPYYEWRQDVMGSPPPHTFNEQADVEGVLYHDWQRGVSKAQAWVDYMTATAPGVALQTVATEVQVQDRPYLLPSASGSLADDWQHEKLPLSWWIINEPDFTWHYVSGITTATWQRYNPNSYHTATSQAAPRPIGLAADAGLRIGGIDYSADQVNQMRAVFRACDDKKANDRVCLIMATIGVAENGWDENTCNSSDHCGVFQLDSGWQRMHDYHDTYYWATYALENGFYSHGGVIAIERNYGKETIGWMVQACQGAGPSWAAAADYYNTRVPEASQIAGYFKGHSVGTGPTVNIGAGAGGTPTPVPDTGGVFDLFDSLNWAAENNTLWAHFQAAADDAYNLAWNFHQYRANAITTIGWG